MAASVILGGRAWQHYMLGAGRAAAPGSRISPSLLGAERHLLAALRGSRGTAHRRARQALTHPIWAGGEAKGERR